MLSLQSLRIQSSKLDTPEPDGFVTDNDATLSQEIFDIAVAPVESVVPPDCIADDIGRESVTFVGIHHQIIHIRELCCPHLQPVNLSALYRPVYCCGCYTDKGMKE